jgi:hypothetical protein
VRRLGCLGCLPLLVVLVVGGGAVWAGFQVTRAPDVIAPPTAKADGVRAQQKIFDLLRRGGSGRPRVVSLSEAELNAFLARHLEPADLPLRHLAVRLPAERRGEIVGQLPLRDVLSVAPLSSLAGILPIAWLDRGIWLSLHTRVSLERGDATRDRRYLRLDVERFWLGRLRLPEVMLRVLLDPAALRHLRWPLPSAIDGVQVERGQVIIQSGS